MGTYMVTHKFLWLNQETRNIYYYDTTNGEPTSSEWQDIVDEIRADYQNDLRPQMSDDWEFYAIDRRRVDTAGLLSFTEIPTAGHVIGSNATDDLPTQVAMLVSVKGDTTKPNRARTYLAGFCEDSCTESQFLIASRTAGELIVDAQSVLNSGGTNVLQRVSAQWNTGHTAVIVTNFISASPSFASITPATQRRRRIGVGI